MESQDQYNTHLPSSNSNGTVANAGQDHHLTGWCLEIIAAEFHQAYLSLRPICCAVEDVNCKLEDQSSYQIFTSIQKSTASQKPILVTQKLRRNSFSMNLLGSCQCTLLERPTLLLQHTYFSMVAPITQWSFGIAFDPIPRIQSKALFWISRLWKAMQCFLDVEFWTWKMVHDQCAGFDFSASVAKIRKLFIEIGCLKMPFSNIFLWSPVDPFPSCILAKGQFNDLDSLLHMHFIPIDDLYEKRNIDPPPCALLHVMYEYVVQQAFGCRSTANVHCSLSWGRLENESDGSKRSLDLRPFTQKIHVWLVT